MGGPRLKEGGHYGVTGLQRFLAGRQPEGWRLDSLKFILAIFMNCLRAILV